MIIIITTTLGLGQAQMGNLILLPVAQTCKLVVPALSVHQVVVFKEY